MSGLFYDQIINQKQMNQKNNHIKIPLGDLQINADYQLLQNSNGRELPLRRKEFQLLKFLANNLNRVINKYAIMDLVWELNGFGGSNTLEVHLSNLRRKLDQLSQQVRIDTIRGAGYRLVVNPLAA